MFLVEALERSGPVSPACPPIRNLITIVAALMDWFHWIFDIADFWLFIWVKSQNPPVVVLCCGSQIRQYRHVYSPISQTFYSCCSTKNQASIVLWQRHGAIFIMAKIMKYEYIRDYLLTSDWQDSTDLVSSCSCVLISERATVVSSCLSPLWSSSSFELRLILITVTCFWRLQQKGSIMYMREYVYCV